MININRIKEIREKINLSLADLSEKTGLAPSYINNIENGHKDNPSKNTMDKLAEALGKTVPELFYK